MAIAVLAVVAVAVTLFPGQVSGPSGVPDAFAEQTKRPQEIRFAYGDASRHRPRSEVRGGPSNPRERISRATLAELEKRDKHELAIATVWNGDNLQDAAELLRELEPTPAVQSDLAAIELLTTNNDNIESILARLEPLRSCRDAAAARATRWNHAVLLSRLELPLSAAEAFAAIANEQEPGWSDEARELAKCHAQRAKEARQSWQRASKAGEELRKTGASVPTELVKAVPGVVRTHFYNAVRTAPSAERVLALAPLAAELDRVGEQHVLSDYVQRVSKLDFRRRAPLASAYARVLDRQPVSDEVKVELTRPASADVVDITMGAMVELDTVTQQLNEFEQMTRQAGDPWFEIVLARAEATVDAERSDWPVAEARLKRAQKLCDPGVMHQCLFLDEQLGRLYEQLHRIPDAIAVLSTAIGRARSAGEWVKLGELVTQLAKVEQGSSPAAARAYSHEALLMSEGAQ